MKRRHVLEQGAEEDLEESIRYYRKEADPATADRFVAAARSTFEFLCMQPEIGVPCSVRWPELVGMRRWPIPDFLHRIYYFYREEQDDLRIYRVLHPARDRDQVFKPGD